MKIMCKREKVLEALKEAGRDGVPLLCPNAETRDELEGILNAAAAEKLRRGVERLRVGIGVTAGYPEHPQLLRLHPTGGRCLRQSFRIWYGMLESLAGIDGLWEGLEVIPFLDHGWAADPADVALMRDADFLERMGMIMFDASSLSWEENVRLTADYVRRAGQEVVVEACPDKIPSQAEIQRRGLQTEDLLSDPDTVRRFVEQTGVDLVVPSLGTEHRGEPGAAIHYRRELARELKQAVGPRLALHGTSSLGGKIGTVGRDGICKINFYTAMARGGARALQAEWAEETAVPLEKACGSFVQQIRRRAAETALHELYLALSESNTH